MIKDVQQLNKLIEELNNNIINFGYFSFSQEIKILLQTIIEINSQQIYLNFSLIKLILLIENENNILFRYEINLIKQNILHYLLTNNPTFKTCDIFENDDDEIIFPETADKTEITKDDGSKTIIDFSIPNSRYKITHKINKNLEYIEIINVDEDLNITRSYERIVGNKPMDEEVSLYNSDFEQILKEIEEND